VNNAPKTPTQNELKALMVLFNTGRFAELERQAQLLLQRHPNSGVTWKILGTALGIQGKHALPALQKASHFLPNDAEAHYNLGLALQEHGQPADAAASYRRALELKPKDADAHNELGNALQALGQHVAAVASYRRALALKPQFVEAHNKLGCALHDLGQLNDAVASYQRALALSPNDAEAHNNLGFALQELGQLEGALSSYRKALAIDPVYAVAHNNMGNVLQELGQYSEAVTSFQRALEIKPDYAEAHYNLGNALQELGQLDAALSSYRNALALKPDFALAHNNLGNVLKDLGQYDAALESLHRSLELNSSYAEAHNNLGGVLLNYGQFDAAQECFRRALALKPGYSDAHSNLLFSLNFDANHSQSNCLEEARAYGQMATWKAGQRFAHWQCAAEPKRLRVGLVSGDLCNHPVAYFLQSLLEQIDTTQIEFIAYPTAQKSDEITKRIQPYFAAWKPIHGLKDADAARMIHNDGVHILLDLSGHTAHNRLPLFAWKPAPVQVSWLGYFATSGVAEMDYLLADKVGVPEDQQAQFTESICYLPDTRLCFTPPPFDVPVAPLPALTNAYITFGCFQNLAKVSDAVLAAWSHILIAVPNSRLRFASKQLGDPVVAVQFMRRLLQSGFEAARVELHGFVTREAYLAAHAAVDVILDTFPYPGGTTTCEALWMGVPTLTLAGETLLARQGASLLSAAGLSDWVANSEDEYGAKAMQFSSDLPKLAALRAGLRQQVLASPLFNAPRFARNFEAALWGMWQQAHDQELAKVRRLAYEASLPKHPPAVEIVTATRLSEQEFWSKSALGISLRRLALDTRIAAHIAFENQRGLPDVFNARIDAQDSQEVLVFMHDDVWIDDLSLAEHVIEGLKTFDVIGVAGNRRRIKNQPGWKFVDDNLTSDAPENLSGRIAHGNRPYGPMSIFGEVPAECELLDGVFMAVKKSTLLDRSIRFDPRFQFHCYDMDFCRSAREQGLRLGTWAIALTHQSEGNFRSRWRETSRVYLDKWNALGKE